jgi:hypothetical protein
MKKILLMFFFSLLFFSCEKDPTTTGDEYNLQGTGKIKTKYIYSSSSEIEPYATNAYTYDENWNIRKILISDYPKPVFASYTYEYSDKGVLINMKYKAINGENHPDQTESDFTLIREYKYDYQGNNKIELEYRRNELTDSAVYAYINTLLVSENHYDLKDGTEWSIIYQYDSNNNLIKKTENPEGTYTINSFEGSRIVKSELYDQNGLLTVENEFVYYKSEGKVIVESHYKGTYGNFVSEKTTYKDGNVIEYIKYHPTFQGAEWFCYRYEYY